VIRLPQIRPITDLRNTNEISEACHKLKEPIFITKNGYGDLVIMSIETYERQQALISLYIKLAQAKEEIAHGEEGEDFFEIARQLRNCVHGRV
jgi:prevent-host-death family protein